LACAVGHSNWCGTCRKDKNGVCAVAAGAQQARLWVLDEPYVAMDEGGMRMLADLIASHLDQRWPGGADQPPEGTGGPASGTNA
jgi:hypothetical protein